MNHEQFIDMLCKSIKPKSYLELGLYKGECITQIAKHVPLCVGVDIVDVPHKNFTFYKKTTVEFFKTNNQTFDVIFIDADHSFTSAQQDFVNSLKILNKGGVIIMHDTDPAELKLIDPGYCGDSYKMIEWFKEYNMTATDKLTYITLPIEPAGLTLIRRESDSRIIDVLPKNK